MDSREFTKTHFVLIANFHEYRYERKEISEWLKKHNTSPKSGAELDNKNLIPNHLVRGQIREYLEKKGKAGEPAKAAAVVNESESESESEEETKEEPAKKDTPQPAKKEEDNLLPIQRSINEGNLRGFTSFKVRLGKLPPYRPGITSSKKSYCI